MTATILAAATPPGRSAVAILRMSGPGAGPALMALTGRPLPPERRAVRVRLADPRSGDPLDDALAIRFAAPRSYTGEDLVELHLHGGRAVVAGVLAALERLEGLRFAEPGEFTRRAFANGKMDLTEAEAVADLIDAETATQRRQALRQHAGALGRACETWRERLIRVLAHLEAAIDFADDDLPDGLLDTVRTDFAALADEIAARLDDGGRGERLRDGLSVAIVGAPNAGKSSLLNRLAGRDAAIVSARAGTTRDVIEVHLELGGYPVILADTAGLRTTEDEVEEEGVRRALDRAQRADLVIAVFDATRGPEGDGETRRLLTRDAIVVFNKADTGVSVPEQLDGREVIALSAKTGQGMAALESSLARAAAAALDVGDGVVVTRARHRSALIDCREALRRAVAAPLPELMAEDARLAGRALGRVTGRVDVEDLLDVIFRDFCLGK